MSSHSPDNAMPLGDHLDELRKRLWYAILGIVPIFAAGLLFGKTILLFVITPLVNALLKEHVYAGEMITTSVLEGFMNYLKIAALLAVIVGGPWLIYQTWKFVAPGLYAREKRFFFLLSPMSVILSALGLAFMYYIMLPAVLFFFVKFNEGLLTRPPTPIVALPDGFSLPSAPILRGDPADPKPGQMWLNTERGALRIVMPALKSDGTPDTSAAAKPLVLSLPLHSDSFISQQYKINEYVNLVLSFALAFVLTFQTPVVVLLLGWAGIVRPDTMVRYRKHAILVCVGIAAIVTPPDFLSMFLLAVPMYLLFEFGLILVRVLPAERVARGFGSAGKSGEPRDGESSSDEDLSARPDDR